VATPVIRDVSAAAHRPRSRGTDRACQDRCAIDLICAWKCRQCPGEICARRRVANPAPQFAHESAPLVRASRRDGILNARLEGAALRRACRLDAAGERLLASAMDRQLLSARGATRVLRVARTIADLAGREAIERQDVAEAIQFRLPA